MTEGRYDDTTEDEVAGKSTRITVDLGSEELVKSLKIAAVQRSRTVRDIVVEALENWLSQGKTSSARPVNINERPTRALPTSSDIGEEPSDKDYVSMMETLNRYRGLGGRQADGKETR